MLIEVRPFNANALSHQAKITSGFFIRAGQFRIKLQGSPDLSAIVQCDTKLIIGDFDRKSNSCFLSFIAGLPFMHES